MIDLTKAKPHFANAVAMAVAHELMVALKPACENIVVAGSLRRRKPTVSDVELLYIPRTAVGKSPGDLFAEQELNFADGIIAALEKSGVLERRKNVNGSDCYGPQNKLMRHVASGVPVNLFSTTREKWFPSLVIRTGPKEFNIKLIMAARDRGLKLHTYGVFERLSDGTKIVPEDERDVFRLAGLPYEEPEFRR